MTTKTKLAAQQLSQIEPQKMPKLFLSHAAKDEDLVEEFVDLLQVGVGVHPDDVFCSSLPGMNIPNGKAFVEFIKSQVLNPELVLLIISPEFLRSQFCNNEVGASWALSLPLHPLLVPPIDYGDVRGVLAGTQVAKLNDKECLNDLRDDLTVKLGLTPFRTSHWERKRDKFLAKLDNLLNTSANPSTGANQAGTSKSTETIVSSSGSWMKLGDRFFKVRRFEFHDTSKISVQLSPENSEDEAALMRLRPPIQGRGPVLGFAYQNEGGSAQVGNIKSLSEEGVTVWSLELEIQDRQGGFGNEISFNEYSADDIAEMRAGRLLINVPPPARRSRGQMNDIMESFLTGRSDSSVRTDECVVQGIVTKNRDKLENALCWARLEAVYRMKATGIVESVLNLTLGPLEGNKLRVSFRGQRQSRNRVEAPALIEINGECELS